MQLGWACLASGIRISKGEIERQYQRVIPGCICGGMVAAVRPCLSMFACHPAKKTNGATSASTLQ